MSLRGVVWTRRGPSPINAGARQDNGLVSAIAISPNDPTVIYQGTAGGGVWRSIDGGATWTPQFDRQAALGIGEPGALAIDPNDTDTLYIGTSQRVTPQLQAGLFKSTDGGNSCIRLGSGYPAGNLGNASQFVNQWVNVIIVDPGDSQVVYLASTSGVFRSTDGGLNWTQGAGIGGDVRSLVLDSSTPLANRTLHAGLAGAGMFSSTDGGQNWTQILNAATPAVAAAVGAGGIGKVIVDLAPPTSPPNPAGVQVLYASMAGTGGAPDPVGVFISTDQGAIWTQQLPATGMPGNTQGSYSFHFAVDPTSPGDGATDTLYFGAVGQARSTDSGQNFTGLNGLHPDTHAWAFAPGPGGSSTVYSGNDGGLFVSTDGMNFTSLNAGGLQTGLFYNVDSKPDPAASVIVGALQDNQIETTQGVAAPPGWAGTNGGDGWDVAYDGGIAAQLYCTSGFWFPAPCTRVWRSTDDGVNWSEVTPWGSASDAGCYLAPIATDPNAGGTVYVSGNQNLWQSQDGGNTWRIIRAFGTTVNPAVAPSRSDNVVVAAGNQVFVSTNALAAAVGPPAGVVFTDITRHLPARNVQRVAFDPNDPTVVYAVLGGFDGFGAGQQGHVFRTTVGGTEWENISPPVNIPYGALALDGSDTPTTIYVGNDIGVLRSIDGGLSWIVLDDIHFPRAPVTDLVLANDARVLRAATYGRGVFEFAQADGPVIAVNLQDGLDFSTVCRGDVADLTLQIFNVGESDLVVDSVQRLTGSTAFAVSAMPGAPLVIAAGEEVDFTVRYTPTLAGAFDVATIRIESNDPGAPVVDLTASAVTGTGALVVAAPDDGAFGDVCLGGFVDRGLVLNNAGTCPLMVQGITSSAAEFIPPGVSFYPLLIAPGDSVEVPVRFQPSAHGSFTASVNVFTDSSQPDPVITLDGTCPPPRLLTFLPDSGRFGRVCVCSFRDEPLTVANSGACLLTVNGIISTSAEFVGPDVEVFPLTVAPGTAIQVPIRFEPLSYGDKSATVTVDSDDPAGPRTIAVSGYAPSGVLAITGSTDFGLVDLGTTGQTQLTLANVGECPLHVCRVAFRFRGPCDCACGGGCGCSYDCDCGGDYQGHHGCGCQQQHKEERHDDSHLDHKRRDGDEPQLADPCSFCHGCDHHCGSRQCCAQFRLVNNPFPTTLQPGSSLAVTVAFTPTCEFNPCCELVICTDDPDHERQTLLVRGQLHRTLATSIKCWAGQEIRSMIARH